jgi:hypothetical protein
MPYLVRGAAFFVPCFDTPQLPMENKTLIFLFKYLQYSAVTTQNRRFIPVHFENHMLRVDAIIFSKDTPTTSPNAQILTPFEQWCKKNAQRGGKGPPPTLSTRVDFASPFAE